jgi:hypothetical protein
MRQYRYLANGSVIKLMHARDPAIPSDPSIPNIGSCCAFF